ncbi:TPA: hypothetical protein KOX39_003423 [Clostridioides difficile]|nr:hypothetical protein [Clostridioides difficile]
MDKKIYAHNIKVGMELKTVWGYAPVVEVNVIDGTAEFNGKIYPTVKTEVIVESDKISKYTYKLTETVYVNIPEAKTEPTVVNVATADELVKPETVIAVNDMVQAIEPNEHGYTDYYRVEDTVTTADGNVLIKIQGRHKKEYVNLNTVIKVDAPIYKTGEVVRIGDHVKCIDRYAEYEGCRGRVTGWFTAKDGRLMLDTTVDGGTWLEMDEVQFLERVFKLDDLSVGDMVKPNKAYYVTHNDTATVLNTYINSVGEAVADVLYTDGHTSTLPHRDIEVLCKASEVDIYPETNKTTKTRGYTRGFKRADLRVMSLLRKHFIPVTKPNKKVGVSDNRPVEIIQNSGEMTINLNGKVLPKPLLKKIDALVDEVGVKVKYVK